MANEDYVLNFSIPLKPEDLEIESETFFYVSDDMDVNSFSTTEIHSLIDDIENKISDKPYSITDGSVFTAIYSCIKHFSALDDTCKQRLLDSLVTNLSSLLTSITNLFIRSSAERSYGADDFDKVVAIHKNALKMFVFCVFWGIYKFEKEEMESNSEAEKKKKKSKSKKRRKSVLEMDDWKERILKLLISVLGHKLDKLWNKEDKIEDSFVLLFFRVAFSFMENPENLKSETLKPKIIELIIAALHAPSGNMQTVISSILSMIMSNASCLSCIIEMIEHICAPSSDSENSVGKLFVSELFREISRLEQSVMKSDSAGTKNLAQFISDLGERVPLSILVNMSVVISHLDAECYHIRNAVLQAITHVICKILKSTSEENNSRNTTTENITKKTRDSLIDILEERMYDVNAYTRSKVLACWGMLCEEKALPVRKIPQVLEMVSGRLYDKSAFVRKAAVHFLSTILSNNPYGSVLKLSILEEKLAAAKKTYDDIPQYSEPELELLPEAEKTDLKTKQDRAKRYCILFREAISFVNNLHSTFESAYQLLNSKTSSDVCECISFIEKSFMFKLDISTPALKKIFKLIWSPEQTVKDAVLESIQNIFMNPENLKSTDECIEVAQRFAELALECNQSELSSLETIVNLIVYNNKFSKNLFLALFELTGKKQPENHVVGALIIINMVATARPEPIRKKIKLLVTEVMEERAKASFLIAVYSCQILQRLAKDDSSEAFQDEKKKKSSSNENDDCLKYVGGNPRYRLPDNHSVFKLLLDLIIGDPNSPPELSKLSEWMTITESALNAIFCLAEDPIQLTTHIIKEVSLKTNLSDPNQSRSETLTVSPIELTKLFFILGHSALKELVLIEDQFKQAKKYKHRMALEKEQAAAEKKEKPKKGSKKKRDRQELEEENDNDTTVLERELGLDPSSLDDHELEETFEKKERNIITESSLYGSYLPLILSICHDSANLYRYSPLRKTAILALCKYMCISQTVCEDNIRLLFTILIRKPEMRSKQSIEGYTTIRNNIIVTIGDLACRYPNVVERYIHHLYSCLRDSDSRIRKNTLLVLSHLVLNDMVKVKSNIFEIVRCIEDTSEEISQLSKSFFTELAKKASGSNNPIYNLLPTILSNLSRRDAGVGPVAFQNIMKFLISFVTKVQHNEKLVRKLCQRFDLVRSSSTTKATDEVFEKKEEDHHTDETNMDVQPNEDLTKMEKSCLLFDPTHNERQVYSNIDFRRLC
ncbi:condensin subunit SMC1 [Naegleria gruberi]|uniref:Condensin subunit SMC1 n=1 Tax=Naegleria gruberi TaxID=5762 RepID=D2V0U2_NAEGR|nr:condensin subunit SMC1 [Naegleria gruberi]EFC49572.1 condensin subunit SMC1 [Naegleria gruberi]|eukprot:XP_002682316.1 condensin subunit SMC1 [Naegleria gruberi strain NEG-M]